MNPTLSGIAAAVAVATMLMAAASVVCAARASRRAPAQFRPWLRFMAALSAVYVAGYAWLAFSDVDGATWSTTMRWVGIVAWPTVWIAPSILLARAGRALHDADHRTRCQHDEDDQ